jgi:isocitrate/isopropylmalate dehydrogenase
LQNKHDHWPNVSLIPGDGVSPELLNPVEEVFKQCGIPIDFEEHYLR